MDRGRRYHINPETGNASPCRAKIKCRFGDIERDHYNSREEAQRAYEQRAANSLADLFTKPKRVIENGERDIVDGRPGHWNTQVRVNGKPTFFPDDAGVQDNVEHLPNSFASTDWINVPRPGLEGGEFAGLAGAQEEWLRYFNNEGEYKYPGVELFDGPLAPRVDEFVRRALNGEQSSYDDEIYQRNFKQMPPEEKFFMALTVEDQSFTSNQVLDAALIFPERDLLPVLQRLGVNQVSISPLKNMRETGLVYTVLTPEGNTRSFSLYEHRNTDSMIISGTTNWSIADQPYGPYATDSNGSESKENFFAEFGYGASKAKMAEQLGYLLSSAQKGTLASDQELIERAERLDWTQILARQIPEFGNWAIEQRANSLDEDGLFSQWERTL